MCYALGLHLPGHAVHDHLISRRRFFFFAAAAGIASTGRSTQGQSARSATYDLVIKGGRVIDPSARLDAVRDVAIAKGRIPSADARWTPPPLGICSDSIMTGGDVRVYTGLPVHQGVRNS